jgi:hypothetical protein
MSVRKMFLFQGTFCALFLYQFACAVKNGTPRTAGARARQDSFGVANEIFKKETQSWRIIQLRLVMSR